MNDINKVDIELLEIIKQKIVSISELDAAKKWTQKDFEFLVYFIEEKTNTKISLSTLKRLYNNENKRLPHISTLNALSQVAFRKDWLKLKKESLLQQEGKLIKSLSVKSVLSNSKLIFSIGTLVFGIVLYWIITSKPSKTEQINKVTIAGNVSFKSDKSVASGVPNTVIFNYDVSHVIADSLFIQQSWNSNNKISIDPNSNYLSSIYYYPGFHRAKLIANDSVIKKSPVHITTNGWLSLSRYHSNANIPTYITKGNLKSKGILSVSKEDLIANNVDLEKKLLLTHYNVRDFGELYSDNFTINTRFKNDSILEYPCPLFELMIMCEVDIYRVRLTSMGCVNLAKVKMGEITKIGSNFDLSSFGTDIYNWQDLRVKVMNKHAIVYLNHKNIFETSYKRDFGKVVGLSYTYLGLGSIDYVTLLDNNGLIVFEDEFD